MELAEGRRDGAAVLSPALLGRGVGLALRGCLGPPARVAQPPPLAALTCTPSWAKKALASASVARCRQVVRLQLRLRRTSRAKALSSLFL